MKKIITGQVKTLDARRIAFVASHERVDRDSELILVAGIDTSDFQRNPLLLRQHDRDSAIARVENLRRTVIDGAAALVGEAVFPDRPASNEALADIRAGLLNTVSIGFQVVEQGAPVLPDQHGPTYTKIKLLEISVVSLPSCPTCTITSKAAPCRCASQDIDISNIPFTETDEFLFDDEHILSLDDDEHIIDLPQHVVHGLVGSTIQGGLKRMIGESVTRAIRYHQGKVD